MGHGLPPALWPAATEEISDLTHAVASNAALQTPKAAREADR
jgi:hypothetical protein